jgi:hypothetical protein
VRAGAVQVLAHFLSGAAHSAMEEDGRVAEVLEALAEPSLAGSADTAWGLLKTNTRPTLNRLTKRNTFVPYCKNNDHNLNITSQIRWGGQMGICTALS